MKFRLLKEDKFGVMIGPHYEKNKRYKPGDVLESDRPLDQIFKGKFEPVDSHTPISEPEIVKRNSRLNAVLPTPPEPTGVDKPSAAPVTLSPPEIISEDEDVDISGEVEEPQAEEAGESHAKYGEDVGNQFPSAAVAKMNVYFDGEKYRVVDPETGRPVSKKLSTKQKVKSFLKSYLED